MLIPIYGFLIVLIIIVVVLMVLSIPRNRHLHHNLRTPFEINHEKLSMAGFTKIEHSFEGVALGVKKEGIDDKFLKIQPEGSTTTESPNTHFSYDHTKGLLTAYDLYRDVRGPLRHLGRSIVPDSNLPSNLKLYMNEEEELVMINEEGEFIVLDEGDEPARFKLLKPYS